MLGWAAIKPRRSRASCAERAQEAEDVGEVEHIEGLGDIREVAPGQGAGAGLELEGAEIDDGPDAGDTPRLPSGLGPTVELLKVLLKARAEEHGVAQKLIATVADLEQVAADDKAEVPVLHGWRRQVFGEAALDLKHGQLGLAVENGRVIVFKRPG